MSRHHHRNYGAKKTRHSSIVRNQEQLPLPRDAALRTKRWERYAGMDMADEAEQWLRANDPLYGRPGSRTAIGGA